MSFRIEIRPEAVADIETTAEWYEQQQPGLGVDFTRTVRQAIRTLSGNPLIYRLRNRRRNVRWFLPPRFPYRIAYQLCGDLITVFAVVHIARHHREWRKRL